jgi:hypothetical protein
LSEISEVTVAFKRKTEKSPQPGRGDESDEISSSGSTLVSEANNVVVEQRPTASGSNGAGANGSASSTTSSKKVSGPYKGRLGDLLIEKGLLTQDQLNLALAEQKENGGKLGELLVTMNLLDAHVLAEALATFFGLVVVNLRRDNVDPAVISLVPEAMAREQLAIPVRLEDDGLYVAVAEPSDELRAQLTKTVGKQVHLMIAPMSDIIWALDTNYRAIGSVGKLVQAFEATEGARRKTPTNQEVDVTTGRRPHPHPGDARPRLGRAHRTFRGLRAGALPH